MKTTKTQNSTPLNSQSSKPFFSKIGEGSFLSKDSETPFFKPVGVQPKMIFGHGNLTKPLKLSNNENEIIQKQDDDESNSSLERSPMVSRLDSLPPPPETTHRPITDNPQRMEELMMFIRGREGVIPYFYCDHRGLVTIGIGHLVDSSSNPAAGPGLASTLAATVQFRTTSGTPATTAQVVSDWNAVKSAYNPSSPQNAGFYAGVSTLRIGNDDINTLLEHRVGNYVQQFIARRPVFQTLDERIQMALIDTRFNAAGIPVFGSEMDQLWSALDYESPNYNLGRALQLFIDIWAGRGNAIYQNRHQHRVNWFRMGIKQMKREADEAFNNILDAINPPDSELIGGFQEGPGFAEPGPIDLP